MEVRKDEERGSSELQRAVEPRRDLSVDLTGTLRASNTTITRETKIGTLSVDRKVIRDETFTYFHYAISLKQAEGEPRRIGNAEFWIFDLNSSIPEPQKTILLEGFDNKSRVAHFSELYPFNLLPEADRDKLKKKGVGTLIFTLMEKDAVGEGVVAITSETNGEEGSALNKKMECRLVKEQKIGNTYFRSYLKIVN